MKRLFLVLLLCVAGAAFGHKPSDAYLTLERHDAQISGQWDIALRDLENALSLDANGDGEITWGEVRARQSDIAAYALARLEVASGGEVCPLSVTKHLIDQHSDGAYAVLKLSGVCPRPGPALAVTYRLFFDLDPMHRGLLQYVESGQSHSVIFSAEARTHTLGSGNWWEQFTAYVREGVWHIWLGFDHILFLLSLLLPAVLVLRERNWQPAERFGAAFLDVAKIVTAFTIAHSITLSLAALGVVTPPSRWIESGIALSVVLAAINNIFPLVRHGRWLAAFGFGLIHGFGFASALRDLGLPTGSLALSLFGFNVGVELGQLAIVTAFLPLAFLLRSTWAYRRVVLTGGSAVIATIAAVWLVERAFDVTLFSALASGLSRG
jgi:hypothetical protein